MLHHPQPAAGQLAATYFSIGGTGGTASQTPLLLLLKVVLLLLLLALLAKFPKPLTESVLWCSTALVLGPACTAMCLRG